MKRRKRKLMTVKPITSYKSPQQLQISPKSVCDTKSLKSAPDTLATSWPAH